MKYLTLLISICFSFVLANAQPSGVKDAMASVFTLKTFSADGTMIGSSNGFFIDENGTALTSYSPFIGASRAIIFNTKGKEMSIESILGANETYDIAKIRIKIKESTPLSLSNTPSSIGNSLWLLPYRTKKKNTTFINGNIDKIEKISGDYEYYTLSLKTPANVTGCPLLNESGQVVGIMQQPFSATDEVSYAVSALFARDLKISGLSINDPIFRKTSIKIDLPDEISQATLTLYIAGQTKDSATYATIVEDFIAKFPESSEGYVARARIHEQKHLFAEADKDMAKALDVAEMKDDVHYNYARLIANKVLNKSDIPYESWTLDKAIEETEKAYAINPIPLYMQLKAQICYSEQRYTEAYDVYMGLAEKGHRTAEIFFEAAQCQQMLGDTTAYLALLDSTVNTFSKPYLKAAAPYLYARANALVSLKEYRRAVLDLNEFEKLMPTEVNAHFYYIRSQAEISGRLYQQALDDLKKASSMTTENIIYLSEKASLEVRVGLYDNAIATAQEIVTYHPNVSNGYLFLGLAQCLKGDKSNGIANLEKAKALGDEQAQGLIDKYSK